jgi:hypothetical protein
MIQLQNNTVEFGIRIKNNCTTIITFLLKYHKFIIDNIF